MGLKEALAEKGGAQVEQGGARVEQDGARVEREQVWTKEEQAAAGEGWDMGDWAILVDRGLGIGVCSLRP